MKSNQIMKNKQVTRWYPRCHLMPLTNYFIGYLYFFLQINESTIFNILLEMRVTAQYSLKNKKIKFFVNDFFSNQFPYLSY